MLSKLNTVPDHVSRCPPPPEISLYTGKHSQDTADNSKKHWALWSKKDIWSKFQRAQQKVRGKKYRGVKSTECSLSSFTFSCRVMSASKLTVPGATVRSERLGGVAALPFSFFFFLKSSRCSFCRFCTSMRTEMKLFFTSLSKSSSSRRASCCTSSSE